MSSCCGDSHKPTITSSTEKVEQEPTGILKKFLWKIGKADAQKDQDQHQEKKGCC